MGIASGEVVAGIVGRADAHDYTVLGDSVNLAARLVAAAGPGQTLLSDGVHRALSGRGVCDALGEIRLKGIDAPARVWRLRGISGEPVAASRSLFVGREAELEQFKGILGACLARRSGQVVYVRGEAGIGKTRLVEEMRRLAEAQGFATHRGLVLDFGVGKGQDPIRALLRSLLGLSPSSDPEERRRAAERLSRRRESSGAEQLAFLHDLLDLPQTGEWRTLYDAMDNAARNRGKRELASALAAQACRREPTLDYRRGSSLGRSAGARASCGVRLGDGRWPRPAGDDFARRGRPARRGLACELPRNAISLRSISVRCDRTRR